MLLFIFKQVILPKIVYFFVLSEKKINFTCSSWITSYPYLHYNFYQAFFNTLYTSFSLSFRGVKRSF